MAKADIRIRLDSIEAGRGAAATAVVLYHASRHVDKVYGAPLLARLFQFGHAGVDFFFVISGFIILFVHYGDVDRPERLGHYLQRRFTRVMPTYWVALAVTVVLGLAGGHALPGAIDSASSILLLPSHREPLLGIAWTLEYEIMFYALFSLLILNRVLGSAVMAMWFSLIGVMSVAGWRLGLIPQSLYGTYNLEFALGMTAAFWLRNYHMRRSLLVLGVGALLFASTAILEDTGAINGYADGSRLLYGIPAALIVLGAAGASSTGRIVVPAVLRILGSASYSVYLFQFVFIGLLWKAFSLTAWSASIPGIIVFLMLALAGVVGGVAMSQAVEYPLIRLSRGQGLRLARAATP